MTAERYLRDASDAMRDGYTADCVRHACAIAELLTAEGRSPWIGRIRETFPRGETVFHAPLTPLRFPELTWNTHYVCCAGELVFDPLLGEAVPITAYASMVFGRRIAVQEFLDSAATADHLREGTLRKAFRPAAVP